MKIHKDKSIKLLPEILCHPNIPQPLHGVAPREIMGRKWWDKIRKDVYASTGFHCVACGVHKRHARRYQWLEAHEFWEINHVTGVCKIDKIYPLCHFCHNFIHSGRLQAVLDKDKPKSEVIEILEHGFAVLARNNLECFPNTLLFAESLGARTFKVKPYTMEINPALEWNDWVLIWEGVAYKSKFHSEKEWTIHYENDK